MGHTLLLVELMVVLRLALTEVPPQLLDEVRWEDAGEEAEVDLPWSGGAPLRDRGGCGARRPRSGTRHGALHGGVCLMMLTKL